MGYWPYDRIFKKYKAECNTFFETGTHFGDSVQDALDLGFKKIISVEINDEYYNKCVDKFKDDLNSKVFLFKGDSLLHLPQMLEMVTSRTMFWLDAHIDGQNTPFQQELKSILEHPIKNHIIVVDDIGSYNCDEEWIKETILASNPDYKFDFDNCAGKQLIAYI
jgi:hypothetical protein